MENKLIEKIILMIVIFLLFCGVLQANRMCAQWEPAWGTLIRYPLGIPMSLVVEISQADTVYTLVENESQQQVAENYYFQSGVNTDNCRWIFAETNSHWTRDWGPQMRFPESGKAQVVDPIFDGYPWVPGGFRDWAIDDTVNQQFAEQMGLDCIDFPGYLTGGNVMYDGQNSAFSTEQMLNENLPLMNASQFYSYAEDILGVSKYHILPNTENYGIQHIDCSAKLLDEETILVKKLPENHPEYIRIEDFVDSLETLTNCYDRPYKIVRIFCGIYNATEQYAAAYTNSLILNNKVYVPMYGIDSDSEALITYQQSMPGYEVIGIQSNNWYYYDALHCRTKNVFDPKMLIMSHRPLDSLVVEENDYEISVFIDDRSGTGLIQDETSIFWRTSSDEWEELQLSPTAEENYYHNFIPNQGVGERIEYYIQAKDNSGRIETLPPVAPDDYYSFKIIENQNIDDNHKSILKISNFPNPAKQYTRIFYSIEEPARVKIQIYNLKGRLAETIVDNFRNSGKHSVIWNCQENSSGIYFYKVLIKNENISLESKIGKIIILK